VHLLSELGTSTRNLVKNSCKNGLHSEKSKEEIYISNQIRKPYYLISFPFAMSLPLHIIDITYPFHCHWHVQMTQITRSQSRDLLAATKHIHTSDDHYLRYGASPIQLYQPSRLILFLDNTRSTHRTGTTHSGISFIK